jgi:hypothetical protein
MPRLSGARLLIYAGAVIVAACGGNRLTAEAPAGVSLAGNWKLDHAASDDPQKLLERMRQEALRRMARHASSTTRPVTRGGGARGGVSEEAPSQYDPTLPPPGADPLQRSPMAHVIFARLARGDYLTVRQSDAQFVLDYGGSKRSFTPGARSVVSAEGGVGDQTSGWKGREYVVRVRAQLGPDVTEHYGLSADGKHLVERLEIATEELSAVALTRVYNASGETAPQPLPTND